MNLLTLLSYSNCIRSKRGLKKEPINVEDIECISIA